VSQGIRYTDRVFVAGQTGSGKSELVNYLWSQMRCQRLLLDTKGGEWTIPEVEAVHGDPAAIDWREPVIHYVTATTERAEIDELFVAANQRRNLVIAVHELGDLCEHSTNKTPASVNKYLAQGRAWGRGLIGASQLPVDMPKRVRTEAQHIFVFAPPMTEEHLAVVARAIEGIGVGELKAELEAVEAAHGEHTFMYFRKRGAREPTVWAPLPEHLRSQIIVRRAEGAE
jgi:hypothetical protein